MWQYPTGGSKSPKSCAASPRPPAWPATSLAAGAFVVNIPGVDALLRHTGTEDLLFHIRKNLFETLTFMAWKPTR